MAQESDYIMVNERERERERERETIKIKLFLIGELSPPNKN